MPFCKQSRRAIAIWHSRKDSSAPASRPPIGPFLESQDNPTHPPKRYSPTFRVNSGYFFEDFSKRSAPRNRLARYVNATLTRSTARAHFRNHLITGRGHGVRLPWRSRPACQASPAR